MICYAGLIFRPLNAPNGEVNGETTSRYHQSGNLLTATYSGGGIRAGQMLGTVTPDGSLDFCYQHVTDAGELRSGKCRSVPERLPDGRLRLHETWQWTSGDQSCGASIVEQVVV